MFDIKKIRENPVDFDNNLSKRKHEPISIKILDLDKENRDLIAQLQIIQEERNSKSKKIGEISLNGNKEEAWKLKEEVSSLKSKLQELDLAQKNVQGALNDILSRIPNLPHESVPVGDESKNEEIKLIGEKKNYTFDLKEHFDLGEELGAMSFEEASNISGARFVIQKGMLSRLERSIANFMLDLHTLEFGYEEVNVPILVRSDALYGTGNLPKFEEDLFKTTDDYFLIPTAEVILTNIVKDKIFDLKSLPMRFVASTPCFRKEAGSYGKDTKGMIRQHQFYKVEMVSIVERENCLEELERMTNCATDILDQLELPYRKIILCSGDMGFSAEKTYDIEVWLPSENKYREISSCSSCSTFQAQRMKTRYKNENKETVFVGTLNGSGLAVGRTLIAVLENFQQKDGSIIVPKVLRPYMNNLELISSK